MNLFEQNGGAYTKVGDYYIPNLTVPECKPIGKYGMICKNYLKNHRQAFYSLLQATGKLNDYLSDIDTQAKALAETLLPQYKSAFGITEQLKADNQMEWVRHINSIQNKIDEIILNEIIFTE